MTAARVAAMVAEIGGVVGDMGVVGDVGEKVLVVGVWISGSDGCTGDGSSCAATTEGRRCC